MNGARFNFQKPLKSPPHRYNSPTHTVDWSGGPAQGPGNEDMDHPIRIGAVNYLNTKPLICDLETLAPAAELRLEVPSRLADLLADGQLDVALIPVIEYFRAGTYSVVP